MPVHRLLLEGLDGAQHLHVQEQGEPPQEVGHRGRHNGRSPLALLSLWPEKQKGETEERSTGNWPDSNFPPKTVQIFGIFLASP